MAGFAARLGLGSHRAPSYDRTFGRPLLGALQSLLRLATRDKTNRRLPKLRKVPSLFSRPPALAARIGRSETEPSSGPPAGQELRQEDEREARVYHSEIKVLAAADPTPVRVVLSKDVDEQSQGAVPENKAEKTKWLNRVPGGGSDLPQRKAERTHKSTGTKRRFFFRPS